VHLTDALDHTASSGNRYIVNRPARARWDFGELFRELRANGFDGTLTSCVFAWEDRAEESSRFMRRTIDEYLAVRR
jgi:myo-inositol catabolism protein IolH